MTYIIAEPCTLGNGQNTECLIVCPVDCIYGPDEVAGGLPSNVAGDQYFIHPGECIDCSLCVDACPVGAIAEEVVFLGEKWDSFIGKNYHAFGLEYWG